MDADRPRLIYSRLVRHTGGGQMCAVDSAAAAGRNNCARRSSSSSALLCACGRYFHLGYKLFLIQSAAFTQQESQNCKAAARERCRILSIVGLNDSVVPISGHSGRCGYSVAHLAEALKGPRQHKYTFFCLSPSKDVEGPTKCLYSRRL